MKAIKNTTDTSSFANEVIKGLSANVKYLPSKFLYDDQGDKLFRSIMKLEEYYPTRCEFEIMQNCKDALLDLFYKEQKPFSLIELGPGDGFKSKVLLKHFAEKNAKFDYVPVDICESVLKDLCSDLEKEIPSLNVNAFCGDYLEALNQASTNGNGVRKVILFMGANIGNFEKNEASKFVSMLGQYMSPDDLLIIGFDLKKDPKMILDAYNDKSGVTKAFNLNMLNRINKELDADFDLSTFEHYPTYDPLTGETKSFLVSQRAQSVNMKAVNAMVSFNSWEPIYMEISKKYSMPEIEELALNSGFKVVHNCFDCRHFFVDSAWQKTF
jgi:dimethylhistidine N-methyltransferase